MKGLGRGGRARKYMGKYPKSFGHGEELAGYYKRQRERIIRELTANKPEQKYLDTQLTLPMAIVGVCSTSAATGNMHVIAQGDNNTSREGRKANITSIQMKGTLTFVPGASATATDVAFLAIILDTQCNGANPAITDVYTTNSMDDNMINLTNDNRFKILKKFQWTFNSTAGVTTAYNNVTKFHRYYKKCNIPLTYNGVDGTIAQTTQNNVFLAYGSTNTDNLITYQGRVRIRFTG